MIANSLDIWDMVLPFLCDDTRIQKPTILFYLDIYISHMKSEFENFARLICDSEY